MGGCCRKELRSVTITVAVRFGMLAHSSRNQSQCLVPYPFCEVPRIGKKVDSLERV